MLATLDLKKGADEMAAVRCVESAFGIAFDRTDASKWMTAGDLFSSLLAELPKGQRETGETWKHFTAALSPRTDVDPARIGRETRLRGLSAIRKMSRRLRKRWDRVAA